MSSKQKTEKKHTKLFEAFEGKADGFMALYVILNRIARSLDGWEDWLDPQGDEEERAEPIGEQSRASKHKHPHDHSHHDLSIAKKRKTTKVTDVDQPPAIAVR